MNFYSLLILYTCLFTICIQTDEKSKNYDRSQLYNELNRELRNYLCCANNMKCCKRRSVVPAIEMRAVLARCDSPAGDSVTLSRQLHKPLYSNREDFQGFEEDDSLTQFSIKNCLKKLLLTIKTSSNNYRHNNYEYIVVDHAYDPFTRKKRRLLVPYVIKFKQDPVNQMYPFKFLHVVNSHVREEVLNKHTPNFTGCDIISGRPTCGKITYKGKVVPYSEGFCCSCDPVTNKKRQPEPLNEYSESFISYSDPAFLLDGIECPKYVKGADNRKKVAGPTYQSIVPEVISNVETTKANRTLNQSQMSHNRENDYDFKESESKQLDDNEENNAEESPEKTESKGHIVKRQVQGSGAQRRGGQNCADRFTPRNFDESYHESAHCIRFSDLWYTVYRLNAPIIEHSIVFQVFEKHEDMKGHTSWRDVTGGKIVRVGTIKHRYEDEKRTISIKYSSKPIEVDPTSFALDYKSVLLLVPEGIQSIDPKDYPEMCGGPSEYLIVHSSQVSLEGDQCNIAGVGFEAFVKQPNRCSRPQGSCLLNQPYHLWKHDHLAEKIGKKGCFFLKFYGKLPKDPIRKQCKTNEQFLVLEYPEMHSSTVDFEIKADFNTVIRPQSPGVITEVYVDSTSPKKTILTVKITNSGLVSSSFIAKLSDCPLEMPASFNNIESEPVLIPPQHQHIFRLNIKCILPTDRFHCTVEALNGERELVALRRVRIQKFDRCICTWHCLCACVGSSEGLKCVPMSMHQYHAAGFYGSMPISTNIVHYTFIDEVLTFITYIILLLMLILLLLGLCKALIGILCSPVIGVLGLDIILDLPKPIKSYYESELRDRRIRYDKQGWPVHPNTGDRVRSVARSTEFCMNVIFFFAYPINVFILLLRRVFCFPCTTQRQKSNRPKYTAEMGTVNISPGLQFEKIFRLVPNIKLKRSRSNSSSDSIASTDSCEQYEQIAAHLTAANIGSSKEVTGIRVKEEMESDSYTSSTDDV